MADWALRTNTKIKPEVLYAGRLLEHYGFIFGVDFDVASAIDKAAKVMADHADEEEAMLMDGEQIAEKIAIDEEPRIKDRRTSSSWKKSSTYGEI
jgi:hypothetical protein